MSKKITSLLLTVITIVFAVCMFTVSASAATSISKAAVSYTSAYTYTGKAIKPKVTVKLSGKTLSTSAYSVSYSDNKYPGKAKITVKGKGSYNGSVTKYFYIEPKAVTSLKAAPVSSSSVKLTWSKATGATGYQVYIYSPSKGEWVKKTSSATNSATVTGLSSGATQYKFKVRAYTKDGKTLYGDFSSSVSVYTKPGTVSSLKATAGETSVNLSWKKVSKATGYQVYVYSPTQGKWVKKTTVSTNSCTITGLKKLKDYKYKVRAYIKPSSGTIYGEFSFVCNFTTIPAEVEDIKITKTTSSSATLSWAAVKGATGYIVYTNEYTSGGKSTSYVKYKSTKSTSITVKGLTGNRIHRFKVRAYYSCDVNGSIYGNTTASDKCRTYPAANDNFYWYEVTNSAISLAWNEDPTVTGYLLDVIDENGKATRIAKLDKSEAYFVYEGLEELTSYSFSLQSYYKSSKTYYGDKAYLYDIKTDDSTVKGIEFTKKKTSLSVDGTYTVKAAVIPSYAANQAVTYKSSDPSVATISSKGKITAIKPGTTKITATSSEGGYSTSYVFTVKPVVSTALDLPELITIFVGHPCRIVPGFIPENTTNQDFIVSKKSDYTYSYKSGLLGLTTKTETLSFSDYITADSNGNFTAKKATVEPNGDKNVFAFNVTFKSSDSGVTKTVKIQVVEAAPTLRLSDDNDPSKWYCSNTVSLSVYLSTSVYFSESDLIWESSDTSLATVDKNGNITCHQPGTVTITAYSPYKAISASYTATIREYCIIEKNYFENCKIGNTYQINASVLPSSSSSKLSFSTTDSSVLSVDKATGLVRINGEGSASVIVSITGNSYNRWQVYFTTGSCEIPSGSKDELFTILKSKANSVKNTDPLVAFLRTKYATVDSLSITNFSQSGLGANMIDFEKDFLLPILQSESKQTTTSVLPVTKGDPDYLNKWQTYLGNIPVAGSDQTVLDYLDTDDIKSIEVIDDGSYVYAIRMTLNSETFASLPQDTRATAHGSVFDILSKDYIDKIATEKSGSDITFSINYSSFKTTYHDSTMTVYINKLTGDVSSIEYDMTLDAVVKALDIDFSYSVLINIGYNCDISFTCNNVVILKFLND